MKTVILLPVCLLAVSVLSGCGGYPMSVESRTPPSAAQQQELAQQQEADVQRQLSRARGAW